MTWNIERFRIKRSFRTMLAGVTMARAAMVAVPAVAETLIVYGSTALLPVQIFSLLTLSGHHYPSIGLTRIRENQNLNDVGFISLPNGRRAS
jgi:hypothetical protein